MCYLLYDSIIDFIIFFKGGLEKEKVDNIAVQKIADLELSK
jgi:hypothetical protein